MRVLAASGTSRIPEVDQGPAEGGAQAECDEDAKNLAGGLGLIDSGIEGKKLGGGSQERSMRCSLSWTVSRPTASPRRSTVVLSSVVSALAAS